MPRRIKPRELFTHGGGPTLTTAATGTDSTHTMSPGVGAKILYTWAVLTATGTTASGDKSVTLTPKDGGTIASPGPAAGEGVTFPDFQAGVVGTVLTAIGPGLGGAGSPFSTRGSRILTSWSYGGGAATGAPGFQLGWVIRL